MDSGFTLEQIAQIVEGDLINCTQSSHIVTGIEYDSRAVTPGSIFVALPGNKVHGKVFAQDAIRAGAIAVLATADMGSDIPTLILPDTLPPLTHCLSPQALAVETDDSGELKHLLHALALIGRAYHQHYTQHGLVTIAVTGSSGKTSTKEIMTALMRSLHGEDAVLAAPGSLNNELGVPWLVTHVKAKHKFLIIEMGARNPGDIRYLCSIAPPTLGIVLGIGKAHIGQFGSQEAIAYTKAELVADIPRHGWAILNADDPYTPMMSAQTQAHIVTFGQSATAQYCYRYYGMNREGKTQFHLTATATGEDYLGQCPLVGEHFMSSSVVAVIVAVMTGSEMCAAITALSDLDITVAHRMQMHTLASGTVIIDDSYNANPDSMRAALKFLADFSALRKEYDLADARTWAILGEMKELGDESIAAHDALGRLAVRLNISYVICVGDSRPVHAMYHGAVMEGSWDNEALLVPDWQAAVDVLNAQAHDGDIIIVKASHSSQLWKLVEHYLGENFS